MSFSGAHAPRNGSRRDGRRQLGKHRRSARWVRRSLTRLVLAVFTGLFVFGGIVAVSTPVGDVAAAGRLSVGSDPGSDPAGASAFTGKALADRADETPANPGDVADLFTLTDRAIMSPDIGDPTRSTSTTAGDGRYASIDWEASVNHDDDDEAGDDDDQAGDDDDEAGDDDDEAGDDDDGEASGFRCGCGGVSGGEYPEGCGCESAGDSFHDQGGGTCPPGGEPEVGECVFG